MKKNLTVDPFIASIRPFITNLIRSPTGKAPHSVGTALLVGARGAHFIVSAAHVLEGGNRLWFFHEKKGPRPVSGEIALSRPVGQTMGPDRLDIGVARLARGPLPPYDLWEAVDISALRSLPFPRENLKLAFVGHPVSQVKVNPVIKHISAKYTGLNGAVQAAPDVYVKMGINPENHLIMELDRSPVKSGDGTWQFPVPNGLSGTPVWSEDASGPCVVAIITEYHKNEKVLVATDIRHVLTLLEIAELNYEKKMWTWKEGDANPYD